jgi:cis-3-alkyl-4-acyloxetan-2-one decarboxylase
VTSSFGFSSRRMVVGGFGYAYVDEGAGPPVVLVHGNPTWSFFFRRLLTALPAANHRVLAPDHIGMGRSDMPPPGAYPFTLERRVADFGDFIAGLDLDEPVTLLVHDWGGAIALSWAVDHPESVAGLVLLNTAAFPLPPGRRLPWSLRLARSPVLGDVAVRHANAFARTATRLAARRPLAADVRRGYLAPYDRPAHRTGILRFVRDIPVRPGDPAAARLRRTADRLPLLADRPVLVCWGMRDFVLDRRILARWEEIYPHAEIHRFAEAGHYLLEDAGDAVVPLVVDFLARMPARGRP